jgi:hypothetical protein
MNGTTDSTGPGAALHDIGKLVFAITVVVAVAALIATDHLDGGLGLGLVGTVVGFVFGNGHAAVRGRSPSPIVIASPEPGQAAAIGGTGRVVPVPVSEVLPAPADEDGWGEL